jgi:hypothetical protein
LVLKYQQLLAILPEKNCCKGFATVPSDGKMKSCRVETVIVIIRFVTQKLTWSPSNGLSQHENFLGKFVCFVLSRNKPADIQTQFGNFGRFSFLNLRILSRSCYFLFAAQEIERKQAPYKIMCASRLYQISQSLQTAPY